ncbi:MAG: YggS family pyridoxal phosphate-dependent enzyme [Acidimicrobiia bacterium]
MDLTGYHRVIERVGEAAARVSRQPSDITVVAVSKGRTVGEIEALHSEGHRDFGENRAGEMAEKAVQLPDDIRWHFVGSLQSNKVRSIRASTHLLHSVDRGSLAKAWVKGIGQPPPILIQVNIGAEEQKGGVEPEHASDLIGETIDLGLELQGLMAIPPLGTIPEDSRRFFGALRELRGRLATDAHPLGHLSMGMTNDFEVAIEEGASIIRVGRAIFGSTH